MNPETDRREFERSFQILVVDDEPGFLSSLELFLKRRGLNVTCLTDGNAALEALKETRFDILVTDLKMPGLDGITLATEARELYPDISIILMTAYGSMNEAIQAVRIHAFDFLLKPLELQHIHRVIQKTLDEKAILWENLVLKKELRERGYMGEFVGISRPVQKLYETIHKLSRKNTPISIEGESGTGKGLLARTIHNYSPRKNEPFVEVNVGAIVPQLMESELFGHVKGSFTGAIRDNLGIVLSAHRGTLFLDEITEIPPELQVKLLGVLQDGVVRPVGGKREVPADVRIITATNRPLQEAVESGQVREDFYYRIRVLPLWIPPLRERKEDIPVIVGHILKKLHTAGKSKANAISPGAMNVLLSYDWPGNVRELENLLERCTATSSNQQKIQVRDLPSELVDAARPRPAAEGLLNLKDLEIDAIQKALERAANNKKMAAELLGIDKSTLHRKIRRYRLE
ncbi:MAG: sigma-54 dependent transcriptional regulator [Deltaproteobacteria bacterium]|nr:sigma-54 dependent transcriptional regulator [Deltaproteobacteria bacterium]